MASMSFQVTVSRFEIVNMEILYNLSILDESINDQLKTFRKTLYEEVLGKKIGQNPPLILQPEEMPIAAEVVGDSQNVIKRESIDDTLAIKVQPKKEIKTEDSDEEIQPENYLFSNDS